MKIITQRDCILRVCDRWKDQYTPFDKHSPNKLEIFKQLQQLNLETCSAKDVADIIGNSSWTTLQCDECGQETDWVLRVGEEPGWESRTAILCKSCVGKAVAKLNELACKKDSGT